MGFTRIFPRKLVNALRSLSNDFNCFAKINFFRQKISIAISFPSFLSFYLSRNFFFFQLKYKKIAVENYAYSINMAMQSSVNFDFSDIPRSGTFIHGSDETIGGLHERNRHDFRIEVMRLPPPSLKFLRISRSFKRSYDDANRWFSILKKKKKKRNA